MSHVLLGKTEIAAYLPHAADMLLLDSVLESDEKRIVCTAVIDRQQPHPLRDSTVAAIGVSSVHAVEYAAQAAGLHIGVQNSGKRANSQRGGVLAQVRSVALSSPRLDVDAVTALHIAATCELAQAGSWIYSFTVHAHSDSAPEPELAPIAAGRFTLFASPDLMA